MSVTAEITHSTVHVPHEVLTWSWTVLCHTSVRASPGKPWLLQHWGYTGVASWLCYLRLCHGYVPEKAMAPHSGTLAWKIPWTEKPVRLQSMGSLRVGHDWATSLSLFIFMHWRRKWQPTPVFLPGESQGRGSLVGCRLWGHTESDTTEATQQQQHGYVIAT